MAYTTSLYAAYGPNMDPELMLERCPHSPLAGTGWVDGWRLTFGGARAIATIVPDVASSPAQYLIMLADAAAKAGAPPDYVEQLRSRPCQ
jgi:hypothetical protein